MLRYLNLAVAALAASAQALNLTVGSSGGNATVSDHQYGIMFEVSTRAYRLWENDY